MSRYCSNCGKENDDTSKFCVGCGEKLSGLHTINDSDKGIKDNKNNTYKNDKEGKNKQIILIGVVVVLVIAIAVVGTYAFLSLSDNNSDNSYVGSANNNGFNSGAESSTVTSSSIPLSDVYGLVSAFTDNTDASSVQYKGVTFTREQCLYIFAKAVGMRNNGQDGVINFKSYGAPNDPLNSVNTRIVSKSEYVDMAQRTCNWMDSHGRAPNYTGIVVPGSPDIGYHYLPILYALVLVNYEKDGFLPSVVSW